MEIQPLETGAGVKVKYTNGSPCSTGDLASTTLDFVCDLNSGTIASRFARHELWPKPTIVATSGTTTRPSATAMDDDKCHWSVVWKTAYACPVCNDDYFNELRSACSGGEQTVSYASKLACYGGSSQSDAQSVSTCTEQAVVLDTKALYSVYAAICIVGFVVLLLMMAILIIHRKYRNVSSPIDSSVDFSYVDLRLTTAIVNLISPGVQRLLVPEGEDAGGREDQGRRLQRDYF